MTEPRSETHALMAHLLSGDVENAGLLIDALEPHTAKAVLHDVIVFFCGAAVGAGMLDVMAEGAGVSLTEIADEARADALRLAT